MWTRARRSTALALVLVTALALTACGGSSSAGDKKTPQQVIDTARQKILDTSGLTIALRTDSLPDGAEGIKAATGTVTDAPAFDGTLTATIKVGTFQVPVKSVGGKVYAQIPLTPGWSDVDPGDYHAPDPAMLLDEQKGIPAILAATTDLAKGEDVRGGTNNDEVLSQYTGRVPGDAVKNIIPDASGDFDASYRINGQGQLIDASFTGVFYPGSDSMTYDLALADYGTTKDITAP